MPLIDNPFGGRKTLSLVGVRFGRLVVQSYAGVRGKGAAWHCKCDCGTESVVTRSNLVSGSTVSCGCFGAEQTSARSLVHGGRAKGSPSARTYAIWLGMIGRCSNPADTSYPNYGAKGITVCDRWAAKPTGFMAFLADMGEAPRSRSIDRIDNNGGYEPGNCRWATVAEQNRNTSRNRWVHVNGECLCVTDAATKYGLSKLTLVDRLNRGWSDEDAVLRSVRSKQGGR